MPAGGQVRRLILVICIALLSGSVASADGDPATGRQAYYRALQLSRTGQQDQARKVLRELVDARPQDAFADDALLELGRIADEEQGDLVQALNEYQELLRRYPESRLSRRASARVRFLEQNRSADPKRLARYQDLLRRGHTLTVEQAEAELRSILAGASDFKLAPEGLFWLAGRWAAAGDPKRARALYEEIIAAHPKHSAAASSLLALAELARGQGRLQEAEAAYAARFAG